MEDRSGYDRRFNGNYHEEGMIVKKPILMMLGIVALGVVTIGHLQTGAQNPKEEDCFFLSSLHYTAEGMRHWYSKESGGFESLTGVPYDDLVCKNCHAPGCDVCHKKEVDGKPGYFTEVARNQEICLNCHSREKKILGIDKERGELDVHFAMGMQCADCHPPEELHGDGTAYQSMKQPDAMQVKCQGCHPEVNYSRAHTVHGQKLDCAACHTRRVATCYNCHFDAQVAEGKKIAITTTDWVFLINYREKVTSGNFQSLEYQDKTFVTFAPHFSHSVMKQGRECGECHGTKAAKSLAKGNMKLTWFKDGELQSVKGVIPVVDGRLNLIFLDRINDQWVPLKDAPAPMVQYSAYGTPLSQDQLKKLAQKMSK
jgi:hypothetical protein